MKELAFCFITLFLLLGQSMWAQPRASEKIKPRWIRDIPKSTSNTFNYELVTVMAKSLDAARQKSLDNLIEASGVKSGIVSVISYNSEEKLSQQWDNGKLTEQIGYKAQTEIESKSQEIKLYVESVAEYWECDRSGNYYLTRLYAKSEESPVFDDIEITSQYGARGLWRSLLIPGWGQFYKGSMLKGGLILGGSAALAIGIIGTEQQRADNIKKIALTHNETGKRTYASRADSWAAGRNVCIGALSALYIYNLIDAIMAAGASRIEVSPASNNPKNYSFGVSMLDYRTPGVTASITF